MEFNNNLGPISKLLYESNVCFSRYIGYYFDELLTETKLCNNINNIHLMVNIRDDIPRNTTCLMINIDISFELLNQIICGSNIKSIILFNNIFFENIDSNIICKNITTIVCYQKISLFMISKVFPNAENVYIFRHEENNKYGKYAFDFEHIRQLHIYSSGSIFECNAPLLNELSIYTIKDELTLDLKRYPDINVLRIDEKIKLLNMRKDLQILQFFPSVNNVVGFNNYNDEITNNNDNNNNNNVLDLVDLKITDLLLPPNKRYMYKVKKTSSSSSSSSSSSTQQILGVYVKDEFFFKDILTIDIENLQIYDNLYPLKMCSMRISNSFYKYFPFPANLTSEIIERFNIQKQKGNLIMIFNFDFMGNFERNHDWKSWYKTCVDTYHRIPIIIQNAQLMLRKGRKEITWPHLVNKIRKECVIFFPEEELLYLNCSPLRLQTLIDKIKTYRRQKFIISKLWIVTNGFEITTKDIEDRLDNIVIVHNEVKMYTAF